MIAPKTLGITLSVMLFVFVPLVAVANTYTLTAEGEQVVFEAVPELGYVTKLSNKKDSFMSVVGSPLRDVLDARRLPIRDRGNVWAVENAESANTNRETVARLRKDSRIAYIAPMFSVDGESVGVIPEIVVKVVQGIDQEEVQALCEAMNLAIIKPMEFTTQEYLLEVLGPDAGAVFAAVQWLEEVSIVEWAWPNTLHKPILSGQPLLGGFAAAEQWSAEVQMQVANDPGVFPDDEYFPEQWYLHNTGQICMYGSGGTPNADINAPEAWEITTGDPNIIVALPDTGVDADHPDLINNMVPGYDFWENDDQPDGSPEVLLDNEVYGHGTGCAGLIAATGNNAIGVTGVTWNCKIMPIRIETADSRIELADRVCSDVEIADAFRWMAHHGADVISNSWGFGANVPITHSAIKDITKLNGAGREGKGCVVLDASGNSGKSRVRFIGRYPEVISVGATDHDDIRWYYSNYGPELDIVAPSGGLVTEDIPGGFQFSTDISGPNGVNDKGMSWVYGPILDLHMDYRVFGGTSGACPVAAGVAALILSVEPNLTNEEVRHFLTRSAKDLGDPGRDNEYGWGRVDARAALDMVLAKRADLDNDWKVDLDDLILLIESWGTDDPWADIAPATKRDGVVDDRDLELMMRYWDVEIPEIDAG